MRRIKKTSAPASFLKYIRDIAVSYDDMDKAEKIDLYVSLIAEQKGVCAYCQQHLNPDTTQIEHHCERSICNGEDGTTDRRLEYKNLMAVCPGKATNETHCDKRKAECAESNATANGLPMQVNPTKAAHIRTITYSQTGIISSGNDVYKREMNHILNLNAKDLKQKRSNKYRRLLRLSKDRSKSGFSKARLKKILTDDLSLCTKIVSQTGNPVKTAKVFQNDMPGLSEYMTTKFC